MAKSSESTGEVDKWRAQVAMGGYSQRYQVHSPETFSPTTRPEQVRIALALAAAAFGEHDSIAVDNIRLHIVAKVDINEAYLNSYLPL